MVNQIAAVHDIMEQENSDFQFTRNGFKFHNRRYFTVQCVQSSEVLTLSFQDIDRMKRDFLQPSEQFFRIMMQQTKNLLKDHLE